MSALRLLLCIAVANIVGLVNNLFKKTLGFPQSLFEKIGKYQSKNDFYSVIPTLFVSEKAPCAFLIYLLLPGNFLMVCQAFIASV